MESTQPLPIEETLGVYSSQIHEGDFWVQAEHTLNSVDRLFIVGIFAGIARFFLAIGQLFYAIVAKCTEESLLDDYFRHSALNFIRALVGIIPFFGSIALANYDKSKIRWAYNNEITPLGTYRKGCEETNYDNWIRRQDPKKDVNLSLSGASLLGGSGNLPQKFTEVAAKAAL